MNPKVLIVEDDYNTLEQMRRFLSEQFPGAEIQSAVTVKAAESIILEAASTSERFDVIYIDYKLPDSEGLLPEPSAALFNLIKDSMRDTVIVYVTAFRDAEFIEHIFSDVMRSPYSPHCAVLWKADPSWAEQFIDIVNQVLIDKNDTPATTDKNFLSCFISYSGKDQGFAERLHADLRNKGVRCWFAPEDLKIGAEIRVGIDESIRLHDKLLLVLSETSVKSQWVQQEVETALAKEREQGRTVLFPIRLDEAVMQIGTGWPAYLKNTRNIGDFTHWKDHDSYQKAFARLLRDLKAEETKA